MFGVFSLRRDSNGVFYLRKDVRGMFFFVKALEGVDSLIYQGSSFTQGVGYSYREWFHSSGVVLLGE